MGPLSEKGGDGGCCGWEGCFFRHGKMHVISSDLSFYHGDTKLGPVGSLHMNLLMHRARLPAALERWPTVIAAWMAMISIVDF